MFRSIALKSAIFAAAGTTVLCFSPLAAQARTNAPSVANHTNAIAVWVYVGHVYPDTSAGLSECYAEGVTLIEDGGSIYFAERCTLGDPEAGYDLWLEYLRGGGNPAPQ
jgi:hypothetical protein